MHAKAPSIGIHTRLARIGHDIYASPGRPQVLGGADHPPGTWAQAPGGADHDHPPGKSGVMRRGDPPGSGLPLLQPLE